MSVVEKLPWESALYDTLQHAERRIGELEAERAELLLQNHRYRAALQQARARLENWKLRQAAWRRERDALLARLREDA